jgi:hypothetical protein
MDVWERVLGFADAQAVLTAHARGVFEVLGAETATAAAIAERVRLPVCSCDRLLRLLVALELLERLPDGRYANTPEARAQLVSTSDTYIGRFLPYVRDVLYPAWSRLDAALEHLSPQCYATDGSNQQDRLFDDSQRLRDFLAGMHAITYHSASIVARVSPEIRALQMVVDVGGASGAFLIALAERCLSVRGLVFDLPPVVAVAREYITAAGVADRVETHAGDFWKDPLPTGADGYALGFILHDWDDEGGDRILEKVATAAGRGATLVVGEHLLAEDGTGPLFAVRQDVNMLVSARGRERSEPEYREWIRRHGFVLKRTYPASYGKHYMVAERL